MLDTELVIDVLRRRGHTVDSVMSVPGNAGGHEFMVDGVLMPLSAVELLLERDQDKPLPPGVI